MSRFTSVLWGSLKTFQAPSSLFASNQLVLSPVALAVHLALLQSARNIRNLAPFATTNISQKTLMQRTGFSKNRVSDGIKELEDKRFILSDRDKRKKYSQFGANSYTIWDPRKGAPLNVEKGKSLFYSNNIPYFRVPVDIVLKPAARWSLASMSGSQMAVFVALLWLANRRHSLEFQVEKATLQAASSLSPKTMQNALDGLEEKGLIWRSRDHEFVLCDPYTGEPFHQPTSSPEDDPANYFVPDGKGVARRLDLNKLTGDDVEALIRRWLPQAEFGRQGNGDVRMSCPFHADDMPSFSVSPSKRCYQCFGAGCQKTGTLTQLLMELKHISKGEAIREVAEATGQTPEFHRPDTDAVIYSYEDENGRLVKQELRYPDKAFKQRRPVKGGYIWNTKGIKPLLYKAPQLKYARTVCIVEGPKDADTVNGLRLIDINGDDVVGTTSGGGNSWSDELAESLLGKRVIVMPDSDKAGQVYAAQIKESLTKRGIEFRAVKFEGPDIKDISDFIKTHTVEEVINHIGGDWVRTAAQAFETAEQFVEA